jgi:putative GTP pyrophosphokinase
MGDELLKGLEEALAELDHVDRIQFRVKDTDRFVEKSKSRRYTHPLSEIEDQVAGRVIVFFLGDIERVVESIGDRWTPVESTFHRPLADAEFGYESHHEIFVIPEHLKPSGWNRLSEMPTTFELQIRTLFMHAYAEPQHEFGYKAVTDLEPAPRRRLAWIASSAWGADRAYEDVRQEVGDPTSS